MQLGGWRTSDGSLQVMHEALLPLFEELKRIADALRLGLERYESKGWVEQSAARSGGAA